MTIFSDYLPIFDAPDAQKLLGAFLTLGLTFSVLKQVGRRIEEWGMAKLPDLPERIQRYLIRAHLAWWSSRLEAGGNVEKQHEYKQKMVKIFRENEKIAEATEEAKEQHYEVPTEFFKLSLGRWLKYSSCYWPKGCDNLDDAEVAILEKICERAQISDGLRVLDLGCGWGSCGLYLLEKYPNIHVTFFSNSRTQQEHIRNEARKDGNEKRIRSITGDVNVTDILDEDRKQVEFDRIVTNEMFEHMKNYDRLFEKVSKWLKPETGLLFIHVFCHRNYPYQFKVKSSNNADWMAKNYFTGGSMPSYDTFLFFQRNLRIQNTWMMNGTHYSKTLEAWLQLMKDKESEISKIFAKEYGQNEVQKQLNNWKLFYIMSSEAFAYNKGNDWCVAHYTFKRN